MIMARIKVERTWPTNKCRNEICMVGICGWHLWLALPHHGQLPSRSFSLQIDGQEEQRHGQVDSGGNSIAA